LAVANTAYAGPFTDRGKLGDLMMAMSAAYAWGMTVMEKDWDGTIQLAESVIASQLVVEGIKKLEIEQRPNGRDWKSLPSGHAAGAFSGAMFVHKRYGWRPAIVPYVMAGITGWSRVDARAHYWHDIAAGAAVSALFTWLLVDEYLPKGVEVSAGPESTRIGFRTQF
jgi:membrane-associated phospholipid phosphatase